MIFKTKGELNAAPATPAMMSAPRPAPKPSGVPTIVGPDMIIRGNLQSLGDLQVDGTVIGDIQVGRLVIAEGGTVHGDVVAQNVRVCGTINGAIRAGMVTLTATGTILGDVLHELLAIETGGRLEGTSRRMVAEAEVVAAPVDEGVVGEVVERVG
jgi:cytoskeletal protein CcmA (bactofilin family)